MLDVLDARAVRRWCRLAADALGAARVKIDAINVFPVPDGDTGTNMHLTILSAAEAVDDLPPDVDCGKLWRNLAHGALLGAHGNSGVILSEVLRGFAEHLGDGRPCRGRELAGALRTSTELAYAAVGRPIEGTVLSVLRAAGEAASEGGTALASVVRAAARGAREALLKTTGQLDVLAKSGVVDAGGAGLCVVLDALAAVVTEEYPETYPVPPATGRIEMTTAERVGERYGYEVMYLLDADDAAIPGLRRALTQMGDSLVVVGGSGLWNVHVHVDDAGAAIEAGMSVGRPHRLRVTFLHPPARPRAPAGRGIVAVVAAEGLARLFGEAGATVVHRLPGAPPPLAALVEAIGRAGDHVVVLPNDAQVIPVAEAAALRARDQGIDVSVIPTRASVQGLAALAVHDPLRRIDDDIVAMTTAAGATRFAELTVADHPAVTSVGICQEGDVLGLIDGDVAAIGQDLPQVATEIVARMLSGGGGELVTFVTGADAPPDLVAGLRSYLRSARPDVETVVYDGGQQDYPLLIGVE